MLLCGSPLVMPKPLAKLMSAGTGGGRALKSVQRAWVLATATLVSRQEEARHPRVWFTRVYLGC